MAEVFVEHIANARGIPGVGGTVIGHFVVIFAGIAATVITDLTVGSAVRDVTTGMVIFGAGSSNETLQAANRVLVGGAGATVATVLRSLFTHW